LLQQAPELEQLQDLAEKLKQCSQCLRDGQLADAADQLGQFQEQLEQLQQQLQELQMLEQAQQELVEARQRMLCQACGGAGCPSCEAPPGMGLGPGHGQGPRPEAQDDTDFYDAQTRQKVGKGAAEVVGLAPGPNLKGRAQEAVQVEFDAVRSGRKDPLGERHIPRNLRDHAQEYFDRFRKGE